MLAARSLGSSANGVARLIKATLALVSKPPRERTGVVVFSYKYLDEIGRSTMSLDGREVVQARVAQAPAA